MAEHFYEPKDGHRLAHDPFKAIITPRPIGWISTVDAEGRRNLAPYSFFNAVSSNPDILVFSSEGMKDSATNAAATGEFVFSLSTVPLTDAMNASAARVGPEVDEFDLAGLTPAPSRMVRPARVAESPASLECKVLQTMQLRDLDGNEVPRFLVFGQVVGVHIDRRYIRDGRFDTAAAQPLARCGYRDYAAVTEVFELLRPGEAAAE